MSGSEIFEKMNLKDEGYSDEDFIAQLKAEQEAEKQEEMEIADNTDDLSDDKNDIAKDHISLNDMEVIEDKSDFVARAPKNKPRTFREHGYKFRNQVNDEALNAIRSATPELFNKFSTNNAAIIDFGSEIMQKVNDVNSRMLEEQKDVEIPEADTIVNNLLRELDGYAAKYNNPKMRGMFGGMIAKIRGYNYTLKSMVRDAKPIADKLVITESNLMKMEHRVRDSLLRATELRVETINAMKEMVKVLAVFEEVLEYGGKRTMAMANALEKAVSKDPNGTIEWDGKKYGYEEFREMVENATTATSETEKTWYAWRQKYFLYGTNLNQIRNIVKVNTQLMSTLRRVRVDAIPSAKMQLAIWQNAEQGRQAARVAKSAIDGTNKLARQAAESMSVAVEEISKVNESSVIEQETMTAIVDNLRKQLDIIVEADRVGRESRKQGIAFMEQAEVAMKKDTDEARQKLIDQALSMTKENAEAESTNSDVLDLMNTIDKI